MENFVIWWLSQRDFEEIGDFPPAELPEYLRNQYRSMQGRNGRGRLWVSTALDIQHFEVAEWPKTPLGARLGRDYGGIVMLASDLHHLATLPGIITTTDVEQRV